MAVKSVFDAGVIRSEFSSAGLSEKFIPVVWKYVVQNPDADGFDDVPSLPSSAYLLLRTKFRPLTSSLDSASESSDGLTTKLLIKLQVWERNAYLSYLGY